MYYVLFVIFLFSPLGQYACKDGRNSPCLVYVSFNHKIYVYWRVELERMEPTNLLSVLEERPEYPDLLHRLGVGEWTSVCVIVCRAQHCLQCPSGGAGKKIGCIEKIKFLNAFITLQTLYYEQSTHLESICQNIFMKHISFSVETRDILSVI